MAQLKLRDKEKIHLLPLKSTRGNQYAITNLGRVISYSNTAKDGRFMNPSLVAGYPVITFRKDGTNKVLFVHRLIAKYFLKRLTPQHKFVIHLSSKKEDNSFKNLKWATKTEMFANALRLRRENRSGNIKLTEEKVRAIKEKLNKGKSLKALAEQYSVSDMTIHRIKTGQSWSNVKI